MSERPDLAGRVAWTYLATVGSAVAGGLVALVAYQLVNPLVCTRSANGDLALTCSLLAGMGLWVVAFAAAFPAGLALVKLDRRLAAWLAMVTGLVGLLIGIGSIGQWWWTMLAVVLPAVAALASAAWLGDRRFRRGQAATLGVRAVAAIGVFTWQVVAG